MKISGKAVFFLLAAVMAVAMISGCQSESEPEPEYVETDTPRGTALMGMIAVMDDTDNLRLILQDEENINAVDKNGRTALMYAARFNRNPEIIEILLEFGADASLKSVEGKTAYDYAVEYNHEYLAGTAAYRKLREAHNQAF